MACHPRCSGSPRSHVVLPGWLGLSKRFTLQFNPSLAESRAETPAAHLAACLPAGPGLPIATATAAWLIPQIWVASGSPHPAAALSELVGWHQQGPVGRIPLTTLSAPQERELLFRHRVV